MIIGKNKGLVIDNIKKAVENGEYNSKVEINDPKLNLTEKEAITKNYLKNKDTESFKMKTNIVKTAISFFTNLLFKDLEIVGTENIKNITSGAIVTSNHFNPLDNLIIQKFVKDICKKRLYILSQDTNFAMKGFIGFFMNYSDTIPVSEQLNYMTRELPKIIKNIIRQKDLILIYPEQEMWFNYKKPRPLKEGAYHFAAKNNAPVISCFVEMIETDIPDNDEFNKVKYVLHILEPIFPDPNKSIKENSEIMRQVDYEQKKKAYEKAYNKKLSYKFEIDDIAGWRKSSH